MSTRLPTLLGLAVLTLAACAAPSGPALRAPSVEAAPSAADAPDAHVSRVVVAPLNIAVRAPAELEGKGEPVWQQLLEHFRVADKNVTVLSTISAERLWLEATLDLDLSDRSEALKTARARFARALAESQSYDLLVVPSLVLRPAILRGRHASWDGVQRLVPRSSELIDGLVASATQPAGALYVRGLKGRIGAASLHVSVLRPDGSEEFEGLGGLDLVQQPRRDDLDRRWTYELRPEPFDNADHLREGVDRAFEIPKLASRS